MNRFFFRLLSCSAFLSYSSFLWSAPLVEDPDPERFAEAIARFEKEDRRDGFKKGGVVFVGSSSIRKLDVSRWFPGLAAKNRGFGGAHISDVNHYAEQTVLKYEPALVVFFCGGNDLWNKKSPRQVIDDFDAFTRALFQRSPQAKLLALGLRPSPKRISIMDTEIAMNRLFAAQAEANPNIEYIDESCSRFLDGAGGFREELFHEDRLHMSDSGYRVWQNFLTPYLRPYFK